MKIITILLLFNLGFLCGCAWSNRGGIYATLIMLWILLGVLLDLAIQFGLDIAEFFKWVARQVTVGAQKLLHRTGS